MIYIETRFAAIVAHSIIFIANPNGFGLVEKNIDSQGPQLIGAVIQYALRLRIVVKVFPELIK